jgi:hypothetical protein
LDGWLYYRIYAKPNDNWYQDLLREIVRHFVSDYQSQIKSFFFFKYHFRYGIDEKLETTCEQKFKVGDVVDFIRLRELAEQKDISNLENELLKRAKASKTVSEMERCRYDELTDIGDRFGRQRVEIVRKYLEQACRISLSLLDEPRDASYIDKISGLIHLPSNILEYGVTLRCPNCKQETSFPL